MSFLFTAATCPTKASVHIEIDHWRTTNSPHPTKCIFLIIGKKETREGYISITAIAWWWSNSGFLGKLKALRGRLKRNP